MWGFVIRTVNGVCRRIRNIMLGKKFGTCHSTSYVRRPIRLVEPKCVHIGANVLILDGIRMEAILEWGGGNYNPRITISDNTVIGQNCHFTAANYIEIGKGVSIMPQVLVTDIEHCYENGKDLQHSESLLEV